jgi:hypothetical protein
MSDLVTTTLSALVAKIQEDAPLAALLGSPPRVFTKPPAAATFPYLLVTGPESRDAGTKTVQVQSLLFSVQVYHRPQNDNPVRQILVTLRDCLHDAVFTNVARCQEEFAVVFDTPDGSRAVARYRVIVSAA